MAPSLQDEVLNLTTTVSSREDARRLARGVLEQRLAACVQLDEIQESHYRWQGRLCADPEIRLTIKSLPDRLPALQDYLVSHHPYALPQLLWQVMQAGSAYAAWVRGELGA